MDSIATTSGKVRATAPEKDEITAWIDRSWDELMRMDPEEVAEYQLNSARQRFETLLPQVAALRAQAEATGTTSIETLDDLVPLLFDSNAYKSYPLSLLEKGRFDLLTRWMDTLTSIDLSHIDASECQGIDEWLTLIEREAPMAIVHTSGTSGKLSFIPRTTLETGVWMQARLKLFAPFGDEGGEDLGGPDDVRLPVIYPTIRHGRATPQISVGYLSRDVAPTPDQLYTLSDGALSADVISLSGRIRIAQAKGELGRMKLTPQMKEAIRKQIADSETRPKEVADFLQRMSVEMAGKRVLVAAFTHHLYQAAVRGLAAGVKNVLAPDSLMTVGGGAKDTVLPEDWMDAVREYTGVEKITQCYGLTEMGPMPNCSEDRFHIPPYYIPFLLDPESGEPLPRTGQRTGRFAFFDLTQQTLWGGGISGDKVTMEWDKPCPCGRRTPYLYNNITRYPTSVSGDDKVLCSATIDNTDSALSALLAL